MDHAEKEEIAKKIFNHLQFFQYLEDVRKHDENILSIFKPIFVELHDKINVEFLKQWDKAQNSGRGNAQHWNFKEESVDVNQFVELFVRDIEDNSPSYGAGDCILSIEVILLAMKNEFHLSNCDFMTSHNELQIIIKFYCY